VVSSLTHACLQHTFREVDANGNWKLNAGSAIEQMSLDTTKGANASDVSGLVAFLEVSCARLSCVRPLQHKFREMDANGNWKLNAGSAIDQMSLDTTKGANASDVSVLCGSFCSRLYWRLC
jgi:hypothetical protein